MKIVLNLNGLPKETWGIVSNDDISIIMLPFYLHQMKDESHVSKVNELAHANG